MRRNFNSRPSARGDRRIKKVLHSLCISIHAPPRGATISSREEAFLGEYFNSRPSARGDQQIAEGKLNALISIHAPPRGATEEVGQLPTGVIISIHAPPRGATRRKQNALSNGGFQFTPLREGRRCRAGAAEVQQLISIHAPPRGATVDFTIDTDATIFQFTPLREGRHDDGTRVLKSYLFQFTPLREGRQINLTYRKELITYFNSRPSARGDGAHRGGYASAV